MLPERLHDKLDQGLWPIFLALALATDVLREFLPLLINEMAFENRPFIPVIRIGDERRILTVTRYSPKESVQRFSHREKAFSGKLISSSSK